MQPRPYGTEQGATPHSTPTRGGSAPGRMCSSGGSAWISSSPWMKPSVAPSSGSEPEDGASLGTSGSPAGGSEWAPAASGAEVGVASAPPADLCCSSSFASSSSSSLAPAGPLPHSLSFSEGGQVEGGVGVQESPSSLAPSSVPPPRGFRWILWWRTRLCFRVKVLSQV